VKSYSQYCPIACALDLVGERWSLLIVRELLEHGQLRYSDLHNQLEGCGTNILAARLRDLERGGVLRRHRLPPPAAATVYELTDYGRGLAPVLHQLAHWGARAMGPPTDDLEPGWLYRALQIAMEPASTAGTLEFRIGGEIASLVEGRAVEGHVERPDAVVTGDPRGFYDFVVERDLDAVHVRGSRTAVRDLLSALPPVVAGPAGAGVPAPA
jgi:DNA-binding HxlR family transcriptional regulator